MTQKTVNPLTAANTARLQTLLNKQVRTSDLGVVTYAEMVTVRLAAGARLEVAQVTDDATRSRLQREYDFMNRGFNVPWGNDRHPVTIKAQALKDRLAAPVTCTEYRLVRGDRDGWTVLPKMVFDWGLTLGVSV